MIRACPQCGGEAFRALSDYSSPPWQIAECASCTFVYLRNTPDYKYLSSEFAWEKTRVAEVERRKARSPIRMWLDGMTRWRAGIYSPGIAGRLKRLFAPGRVLDVGCGSGKKVPEPFIPFGVEISEALSREADDHMRARGGRAIHAPAVDGVREFPDRFFTGILLRSFLEQAFHAFALGTARCLIIAAENLFQTNCMFFGLFKMFLEARCELLVACRFDHFGQSGNDLFLGDVEVFQLVNVKVFEGIKFHNLFYFFGCVERVDKNW